MPWGRWESLGASDFQSASFDGWQVTMVTVLVGPSTQSGIALIDASEGKNLCSFSYAKDCTSGAYSANPIPPLEQPVIRTTFDPALVDIVTRRPTRKRPICCTARDG